MFKTTYNACAALLALSLFIYTGCIANAQIAPTSTATISGSVSDSSGKPVVGATVSVNGPKSISTKTDQQGLFAFVGMPFGVYRVSASATGIGTATRSLSVEGDTNIAIQYEPASVNGLKTIAQVSSSINANFDVTPASITQVNPMQKAFEGVTSWRTILEQIPGVAQSGVGFGQYAVAAYPDGPLMTVKISINGGLPYETATLLDNMPLISASPGEPAGSGTNLGIYPLNGFDAADIVRGPGAAAPSIVDSIGGSFVLHAPGPVSQNSFELSVSNDAYGGVVINTLAAMRFGKLSVTATYGINDSPGPVNNSQGIPSYTQLSSIDGTPYSSYAPPGCNPPGCLYGSYLVDPALSGGNPLFSNYGYYSGLLYCCVQETSAWSEHTGSMALRYAFSPKVNAEIFYSGSGTNTHQPSEFQTVQFAPPPGYTGSVAAGQYSLSPLGYGTTSPDLTQGVGLLEEKVNVQLGRGVLNLAALQNHSFCSFVWTTPASATVQLFGGGNGNTYNGSTHTIGIPSYVDLQSTDTNNRDILLSYQTPVGGDYHAGISFVKSYYDMPSGELFACDGFTEYLVSLPSAVSETTNEFRLSIGGNPTQKTSLDLSEYFANVGYHVPSANNTVPPETPGADIAYTDVNYTYEAPRLGFVWRPSAAAAIRASAGGGFAGSALQDFVGSPPSNSFAGYYAQTVPNLSIQPERSFSFDIGTDIKLRRNTMVSFDVYRSNLYGQLYSSTTLTSLNYAGTGQPLYTTQFENLGVSRYEGILLDVRHQVPHGIYWTLAGGLTRGYLVSVPASFYNAPNSTCNFATTAGCVNLNVVPGINFNGTMNAGPGSSMGETGASIPYSQGRGEIGYRWNPEKYVALTMTYFGNNNTYFRQAFAEFDGNIGYPLTRNVSLLVNFRNITNIYGGTVQLDSLGNFIGVPALGGAPYAEYGEEYGPRAVIVTAQVHL